MPFFLADRVGVDNGGAELRVTHPFLNHVERNSVHRRVDPEPVPEALWAAVRRIREARLYHDAFHDLPDPDSGEVPDGGGRLPAGLLRLTDPVGGGQSIEELGRDWDGPEHDLRAAGGVPALLAAGRQPS